jgi:hypothetical protein
MCKTLLCGREGFLSTLNFACFHVLLMNPNQLPVDWDTFLAELNLQPQHPNMCGVCLEDLEPGWLSTNSDTSSAKRQKSRGS